MKSQRRHELETNELAKRLSTWGDRIQPYSTVITVTVVVIAAGILIALFVSNRMAAGRRAAWDQFTYVMTGASTDWDALRAAAEENPNTRMSELATITWADAELRQATNLFFRDQAAAETHLDNAIDAYRRLINEAKNPDVVNRARLGMARALETGGKPDEAIKFYRAVEGPFAEFAKQRADELTKGEVQESVTWLANAEMPDVEAATGPGTPGARPPFGSDFSLDPSIPARIPSGLPAGAQDAAVPDPLAPQGATGGQVPAGTPGQGQPLNFENPFASPPDPDRYATPPADGGEDASDPLPTEPGPAPSDPTDAADPTAPAAEQPADLPAEGSAGTTDPPQDADASAGDEDDESAPSANQ